MPLIKQFPDGTILEFGQGNFDNWLVLLTNSKVNKYAPKDSEYFRKLEIFSKEYGANAMYKDFVHIYERTDKLIKEDVLELISEISKKYPPRDMEVAVLFSILYATMVAEENKRRTRLGKRIKRLAIYQLLIESVKLEKVVIYSKGMVAKDIATECVNRGF